MTPNPPRTRPFAHALDRIWQRASAPQTFVALAMLLAGTLALAAVIPQQPSTLTASAAESWLAATTASYRDAGAFLRVIGAFNIVHGVWLRMLLAALGFHLALRLADQLRAGRRTLAPPQANPPPAGLLIAETRIAGPLAEALARIAESLRGRYPVILIENDTARAQIYAERRRTSAWAPALALAGALLVLAGLVVDATWGGRSPDLALAPGSSAMLDQPPGARVTIQEIGGPDTAPQARVVLTDARSQRAQWLAFAWPTRLRNLWVAQQTTGLALAITAVDASGNPLLLQELAAGGAVSETLHVLFRQTEGEQAVAIPARNLALRAVAYPALPDQDITEPVILVETFRGTDPAPLAGELVETGASITVDDTIITLRRERYAVLAISYLPGLWLQLVGVLLVLGGTIWHIGWGVERAWLDLAAERDMVGIAARVAGRSDVRSRAERLLAACIADTPQEAPHAG